MAVQEQRTLPAPFIESIGKDYAKGLTDLTKTPLQTGQFAPKVAPQHQLQQDAVTLAQQGLGGYEPYITGQGAYSGLPTDMMGAQDYGAAASALTGTGAGTGAGSIASYMSPYQTQVIDTTLAEFDKQAAMRQQGISDAAVGMGGFGGGREGVMQSEYQLGSDRNRAMIEAQLQQQGFGQAAGLTGTGTGTGLGSISSYMSPYQSQVIDTTLAEFDKQAAMRQQGISDQAVALGGFGGGREGVMQSEYQSGSDAQRAALQAQMLQQGFGQAAGMRQQDYVNQMGLAQGQLGLGQAQLGLGSAQAGQAGQQAGMAGQRAALAGAQQGLGAAQLGLGQYQQGLGGTLQGFQGTDIARAGQVGAADQAFAQANIDAQREKERMGLYEPYERLGFLGSGLTGLMGGMGPQYQFQNQGSASPLATALGVGSTLGGIYGNVRGNNN